MTASARYKTINDEVGRRIIDAVKRYPGLGRKRLWAVLREEGIEVNPVELKRFMQERRIGGARPGPAPPPRTDPLTGLMPRFPDLGGRRRGRG